MPGQRTLLVMHHRDRPTTGTPEQRGLRQRGHHRFERRRDGRIVVDQPQQHLFHVRTRQLPQRRYVGWHRREEPVDQRMIDQPQPLRPRHRDERVQELGPAVGPVDGVRALLVIALQAGARAVRRFGDEQLDHPAGDVPGLVDDVDVRTPTQGGQEPLELGAVLGPEQQVGLVLGGSAPTGRPQYGDHLGGLRYGEIHAGVGDHGRLGVQEVAPGESRLVTGDLDPRLRGQGVHR